MKTDDVITRIVERMAELGVKPQAVSKSATGKTDTIRNWLRKQAEGAPFSMRQDNLEAVARALGVSLAWLLTGSETGFEKVDSFQEETAAFTPKPNEIQAIRSLYSSKAKHPQTGRRSQVDLPGLGIANGDLIVIDLGREPAAGDLVLVTVLDGSTHGSTVVRRYFPPYLFANSASIDNPPMKDDQSGVTVRYPVIGLVRGIPREPN